MPDLHAAERTVSAGATPPVAVDQLARHRSYQELVERLRDLVHRHVPPGATVAVVSKGDPDLVSLVGRQGWHFPQDDTGGYVGYHPRDSASAIEGLEDLRSRGADFLVLPATSNWWLDYYGDFGAHLRLRYEVLVEQPSTGIIFALRDQPAPSVGDQDPARNDSGHRVALLALQIQDLLDSLVPRPGPVVVADTGEFSTLRLEGRTTMHLWLPDQANAPPFSRSVLVARLESHRQHGAACLVIPIGAFDWWGNDESLRPHVEERHRCITRQSHVCLIYDLEQESQPTKEAVIQ